MIKVFHIITHFDLGGSERVAINICKSKNSQIEYHIFEVVKGYSEFSKSFMNEMKENNIFFHQSYIKNRKIAILLFPIFFFFKTFRNRPDLIHTHTEIPDLSIFIYDKLAKIFSINNKYVRTIHNTQLWNEWKKIGRKVEPFFQKQEANVAISESVKQNYELEYQHKVDYFVYNGVEKSVEEKFYNIIPNKINVLFAGRLEHQKGIIELVSTLKKLSNDQRFHFHISGKGKLDAYIKEELKDLSNISYYESIFGLNRYLSSFDFLFMPSNFEGLPLMSVEASFEKLPSIINNCDGLREVLPDNWVLKVENNNVEDYVKIFNEIEKYDTNELKRIAYNFVQEKFSLESMQQNYEKIYLEKINEK